MATPGVVAPPVTAGQVNPADQGGVRDLTGERAQQLAAYQSDIQVAMLAGMGAENRRRGYDAADMLPQGAMYGDLMDLSPVPSAAMPRVPSDLYWPKHGDEPFPEDLP